MIKISPKVKNVMEWIICVIIAIILALLFRHFIGTPTVVKQTSMQTTLMQNDRLILNRWVATVDGDLKRGDIITFEAPSKTDRNMGDDDVDLNNPVAIYDYNPTGLWEKFNYYFLENGKVSFIKRVIGLPGEHVQIKDGKVYIDEKELSEDYLPEGTETGSLNGLYTNLVVPEGYIYVLGDNRRGSTDSREFGCIPLDRVESKVLFRFWPLNKFGKVN